MQGNVGEETDDEFQRFIPEIGSFEELYSDDINMNLLKQQLKLLPAIVASSGYDSVNIYDAMEILQKEARTNKRVLISEVIVLAKLILVSPATNAESERMFSALRRLKTYLRSTMSEERLNYLMVLHVQKEKTDSIDLIKTANSFVNRNENRKRLFGIFSSLDRTMPPTKMVNVSTQTATNM